MNVRNSTQRENVQLEIVVQSFDDLDVIVV
jgi:hypothetical protein